MKVNAKSGTSLVPVATAEADAIPTSAAKLRLVSVDQVAADTFCVYIIDGAFNPVNSEFVVIVTGG